MTDKEKQAERVLQFHAAFTKAHTSLNYELLTLLQMSMEEFRKMPYEPNALGMEELARYLLYNHLKKVADAKLPSEQSIIESKLYLNMHRNTGN